MGLLDNRIHAKIHDDPQGYRAMMQDFLFSVFTNLPGSRVIVVGLKKISAGKYAFSVKYFLDIAPKMVFTSSNWFLYQS